MNHFVDASKALHKKNNSYGKASEYSTKGTMKYELKIPNALAAAQKVQPIRHILDYGCGKGGLVTALRKDTLISAEAHGYDPAIEIFSKMPRQAYDIVISIDVFEHIGIEYIGPTIAEIKKINTGFFFFCIDLLPASKKTPDGRNAHFLIAPADWWVQQIKSQFKIITAIEVGQMPDKTHYPIHLLGCATNSMKNFHAMSEFLRNVPIANKDWIWNPNKGGVELL